MNELKTLEFKCDDLSKYPDPMLYDSGKVIAYGKYGYNEETIEIKFSIVGEVRVWYNDLKYDTPSEFPIGLKRKIKNNPQKWEYDLKNGWIDADNYFSYVIGSEEIEYGTDISGVNASDIEAEMLALAKKHFNVQC